MAGSTADPAGPHPLPHERSAVTSLRKQRGLSPVNGAIPGDSDAVITPVTRRSSRPASPMRTLRQPPGHDPTAAGSPPATPGRRRSVRAPQSALTARRTQSPPTGHRCGMPCVRRPPPPPGGDAPTLYVGTPAVRRVANVARCSELGAAAQSSPRLRPEAMRGWLVQPGRMHPGSRIMYREVRGSKPAWGSPQGCSGRGTTDGPPAPWKDGRTRAQMQVPSGSPRKAGQTWCPCEQFRRFTCFGGRTGRARPSSR